MALKKLGYDAMALGESELKKGDSAIRTLIEDYKLPIVATNIIDRKTGHHPGRKYIIKRVGRRRWLFGTLGGKKIGIFSVILPSFLHNALKDSSRYTAINPGIAALEAVSYLKSRGCDLIVAISHAGWEKSIELAKSVDGIDIIINAHRNHKKPFSVRVNNTLVVDSGEHRKTFPEILIEFTRDGIKSKLRDTFDEAMKAKGDKKILRLYREFESLTKDRGIQEIKPIKKREETKIDETKKTHRISK